VDLDSVLLHAVSLDASDVHLKFGQPPVVRRDGSLERLDLPPLDWAALTGVLDAVTARDPRRRGDFDSTGELDIAYDPPGLPRFRVTGFVQRGTPAFAFRLIPARVPTFDELRLPPGVRRLAEERHGLIVVTGATGSGKTTTVAALVDHINRTRSQHIVTIEDPIEILHADHACIVSQRDVGDDTASYQEGLRRALRQDPDVLVIGELRDEESAQTALNAAESGHLVLTTLHTTDAAETVKRLVDYFPAAKQPLVRNILSGVVRGVISQRLLPRVAGGRVVAVELMIRNARIAEAIREDRAHDITEAIREGAYFEMQTLTQALLELVVSGEVDREVAAGAASNRHDFLIALRDAGMSLPGEGLFAGELPTAAPAEPLGVRPPALP
jgi:twitching motility protein PilT